MADADEPSDTLRARVDESRLKLWLLMEAERWLVSVLLLGGFFLVVLVAGAWYADAVTAPWSGSPVATLFQSYVAATITGVTLVVTLNQLVLSQELGAAGDQRDRMEEALRFRDDVAGTVGAPVSPARPSQFLMALVETAATRAETLRAALATDDEELQREVDDLVDSLVGNADRVTDSLDDSEFGQFQVVSDALNFNYSWKVFAARRIRGRHGDGLGERADEALEDLTTVLELFGPAREHVKTLYFQWELVNLSRTIMATALPALAVSVVMVVFYTPGAIGGTVLGVGSTVYVVTLAATVATLPFVVLLSYVARIATVAKHTLSIGPFILRDTDQVERVEWDA